MQYRSTLSYDAVVCGCGVAGFAAAVQCARAGLRTAVVERYGMPGGILTVMGNNDIAQFFAHHRLVIRGIGWEYVNRLAAMGYAVIPDRMAEGPHWIYGVHVNIPAAAHLMDQMLLEAGVTLYYGQPVADVITADSGDTAHPIRIDGVVIASKEGPRLLSAPLFIDCTGDGDIAAFAGAATECGDADSPDSFLQPGTLRFFIDSLPLTEAEKAKIDAEIDRRTADGTLHPADLRDGHTDRLMSSRGNNIGHVSGFNAAESDARTASEVEGRASVFRLQEAIRAAGVSLPVETISPEVGVRESRRIVGDVRMTEEAYVAGFEYPDAVCTSFYPIDLHRDGHRGIRQVFLTDGQIPTVPLGALIARDCTNLLMAGRCASGDRMANSAYRVKASCMAMGQAAAACAAIAHQTGVSPRAADLAAIRALLRKNDAIVTAADIE